MIYYEVNAENPHAHLFTIKMIITSPTPTGQQVSLPNWIPGSYFIRDFARHILQIEAFSGEAASPLAITKVQSNTWCCAITEGPITLQYTVYAYDPSVRGAYLDCDRAFFNGCALFLRAHGQEGVTHKVKISAPHCPGASEWRVATTLPRENATQWRYGWFVAPSYHELIDHPVEIGHFELLEWRVDGIPHQLVVSGKHDGDLARLAQDVAKICQTQIRFFKEAPFSHYLFILNIRPESYGGLEHQSSSVLQIARENLPLDEKSVSPGYTSLLGLFSHEYFHAWNVKKIRPDCFIACDLDNKVYTTQLWAFEGITSYYDNLMLARAKVISRETYYDLLAYSLTKLLRNPGRKIQTVTDSSFDTWIKFYQPNENSINSMVSYYTKGELIALAIDLTLRLHTPYSLDDVMSILLQEYGLKNKGVTEKEIEAILEKLGGKDLVQLLHQALYTTEDLPWETLLDQIGLTLTLRQAINSEDMGGKNQLSSPQTALPGVFGLSLNKIGTRLFVSQVFAGGAAEKAGMCAGDEIIALKGFRVDASTYDKISKRLKSGEAVEVQFFRQDYLQQRTVIFAEPLYDTAQISAKTDLSDREQENLHRWLS